MSKQQAKQLQKFIDSHIADKLKSVGFKQTDNYFYRVVDEVQQSLEFRLAEAKNKSKVEFIVLAGLNAKAFDSTISRKNIKQPKGYDNIFCHSINELTASANSFNLVFDKSTNTLQFAKELLHILQNVEKKIIKINKVNKFVDYCIQYNKLVHKDELFKYLVITKDEVRLQKYLKQVKKHLMFIANRAYSVYLENIEILKNNLEPKKK